ncbi:MAG: glycosyltransferase family 4 protein [Paracoccaceae bacterium]
MKILQVSHNFHIVGGSDAMFFKTSSLLEAAGHEVIPFCMTSPKNRPTPWAKYFARGADTANTRKQDSVRYFYNYSAKTQLNRLLDEVGEIDIAHLHIYHGKQTPSILSVLKAREIPILQTLHEYKLACPTYTMQRDGRSCDLCVTGSDLNCVRHRCKDGSIVKSLVMSAEKSTARILGDVRLIDRFLCVSDFQRQIMLRAGIPSEKLFTLHNFASAGRSKAPANEGYFLYFGRIEKLKGLQILIAAFKQTNHKLRIAGDGNWRGDLVAAISKIDNITFEGFKSGAALDQLIEKSQAVIVPSEWNENCPMAVLEAKAAGKPVIGTKIGGIPELIRHRHDGFLFEPGDKDGLIAGLNFVAHKGYEILAQNALADAQKRFSPAVHLSALLAHYADIATPVPRNKWLSR